MNADDRRAQILRTARRVLARDGIGEFSLEEVAREAGVAATLPRHYFGSRDGLLAAAVGDFVEELADLLTATDRSPSMTDRIAASVAHVRDNEWVRTVWVRAPGLHPEIEARVRQAACSTAEVSFGRSWHEMTPSEQIHAAGWVGYAASAVTDWLERETAEMELLLETLTDGARRLGVNASA